MAVITICTDFGAQKIKSDTVSTVSPFICHEVMGPDAITSWEIDGETVSDFIFGGSKITADGDCSHEIKRHVLLGGKTAY